MLDLYYKGGPLFMGILTIELIAIVVISLMYLSKTSRKNLEGASLVRSVGLLAFITGILAQTIGLYEAMKGIEMMGGVSAPMLAGGLKISFIAPIYGLIIFALALILNIVLKLKP